MKKNTINTIILTAVGLISASLIGYSIVNASQFDQKYKSLQSEYKTIQTEIDRNRKDNGKIVTEVEKNIQGVSNQQLKEDKRQASIYFAPAFTWTSGDEYDSIRKAYIDKLGADSQFVQNYLKENIRIEVANKDLKNNDIDIQGLKSNFEEMVLYPTTWKADGTITYIGVIKYYVFKNTDDLNDKTGLLKSKAVVEFTMSGSNAKDRRILDVKAYAGSLE